MAFYVVLHHPRDPHQPWANAWRRGTEAELDAFTTTRAIAQRCRQEGSVYVHRCGFDRAPPRIVCEADVVRVDLLGSSALVTLRTRRTLNAAPTVLPSPGQSFYDGDDLP